LTILADTSIWIQHLRRGEANLQELLHQGMVLMHPFILGELACGNVRNRSGLLEDLKSMPVASTASDDEVLKLVDSKKLWTLGIGWIDAHLLASALLTNCPLWTLDSSLKRAAASSGISLFGSTR
jgi:predicted nucleic acid-binding protein